MSVVWRTAQEIAGRRLPGLPTTERAIRRLPADKNWPKRRRAGTKAWEFPDTAHSEVTQAALAARDAAPALPAEARLSLAPLAELRDWRRAAMQARLILLRYVERQALAIGRKRAQVRAAAARADLALPPLRTIQRTIAGLGALARNRGRMGPREIKSLRAYVTRTTDSLLPADVYTADGHRFDAEVAHPVTGKPFRPEIISILDVATRRCVGWSSWLAESAVLVADALRVAAGVSVPAIFYADNGGGFKNAALGDEALGTLSRLERFSFS